LASSSFFKACRPAGTITGNDGDIREEMESLKTCAPALATDRRIRQVDTEMEHRVNAPSQLMDNLNRVMAF